MRWTNKVIEGERHGLIEGRKKIWNKEEKNQRKKRKNLTMPCKNIWRIDYEKRNMM